MEAYIIGEKTSMPADAPTTRKYYYPHNLSNNGTAYVQDMVRIANGSFQGSRGYTIKWPSSIDEKKNAIDGLFEMSVATKGGSTTNDIYINNLSGYFITNKHEVSWYPAYSKNYHIIGELFPGNSKGGDYKTCAETLTEHVYKLLSGKSNTTTTNEPLAEGPWGLVMMDYVGSATNSKELVNLIMMNNFAGFELAEKKDENKAKTAKVPLNDEKISPELDVLINWD